MGPRLAFNRPAGERRFSTPSDSPHANGGSGDEKQPKGTSAGPQFNLLGPSPEDRKRRWLVLGLSPVFEAFAVAIMVWALMSLPPNPVTQMAREEVLYFHLERPAPVKEPPRLLERPVLPHIAATPVLPRIRQEKIQRPVITHLKVPEIPRPKIQLPETPPRPKPAETFSAAKVYQQTPKRQMAMVHMGTFTPAAKARRQQQIAMVHTGAFNPGSMAKGTVNDPLEKVQTGGFGAENGIPNNPSADSHTRIAQLGSFDLPVGPGHGNGTGGAQGVRGTVASAGFGNGIGEATGSSPSAAAPQTVHKAGFGSVIAEKRTSQTRPAVQEAAFKPVVILSKPNPVYPPEARRDHIQGQVILSVLFGASGNLRVLKVEHGLGHGMDAAAIQAAEQIKFKPAERNGRPVDSTAIVHIIFQLAY